MSLLILYGIFWLLPVLIALKLRKGLEETAPFVVFSSIIVMFGFGLLRNLSAGVWAVVMLSAVAMAVCLVSIIKEKDIVNRVKKLITPAFIVFTVMFVFFWYFSRGRAVSKSDEFSHWALIIKNMMEYNNFGNDIGTTTEFFDYPPGQAVLLYLFTKITGVFNEGRLYFAGGAMLASIYGMCIKPVNIKKVHIWVPLTAAYISLVCFIRDSYPFTLYVDHKLAYIFAFLVLYWVFTDNRDSFFYVNFSLGLAVLTLIKSTGLALSVFVCIIAFADEFIGKNRKNIKILALIMLPLLVNKLWSVYVHTYTQGGQVWNTTGITLSSVADIFRGTAPAYRYETIKLFTDAVVWGRSTYMPYGFGIILAGVALFVLAKMSANRKMKKLLYIQSVCVPLFMFAYAAAMLVLYLFTYAEFLAINLASYDRYMSTMFIGAFLVVLAQGCIVVSDKDVKLPEILCPAVCAAAVAFQLFTTPDAFLFRPADSIREVNESVHQYQGMYKIEEYVEEGAKICVLSDGLLDGQHIRACRYILTPHANVAAAVSGRMFELIPGAQEALVDTTDQWIDEIKARDFDYLYLHLYNTDFVREYGKYFEDAADIAEKCLYSFDGEKFRLVTSLV